MAKQTINNLEAASTVRRKLNDNFTELYSQKADKNHSFTDSSYGAASNELYGHVKIASGNGLIVNDGLLNIRIADATNPGAVRLANSFGIDDDGVAVSAAQGKELNERVVSLEGDTPPKNHATNTSDYGLATDSLYGHLRVTSGNGLILNNGTLSLNAATTANAGAVQLEDTLESQSSVKALTANMGYYLDQHKAEVYSGTTVPTNDIGKNGDIYFLLGS